MSPWKGWEDYKPPQYRPRSDVVAPSNVPVRMGIEGPIKRSKYGAEPTTVDRIRFDSKREAARYAELCVLRDQGLITDLELQPQFPLSVITPAGTKVIIGRYIADFRYRENGELVIEDSKGYAKNPTYLLKKKHVEAEYAITIRET